MTPRAYETRLVLASSTIFELYHADPCGPPPKNFGKTEYSDIPWAECPPQHKILIYMMVEAFVFILPL